MVSAQNLSVYIQRFSVHLTPLIEYRYKTFIFIAYPVDNA